MKRWDKMMAVMLAMAMSVSMTVTAFADDDKPSESGGGTVAPITADDTSKDDADAAGDDADADADKADDAGDADADDADAAGGDAADAEDKDEADAGNDNADAAPAMNYSDVTEKNWFHGAVSFVTEKKLMDGLTDTTFGPSENMTRQMLAVALYRLAGSPEVTAENPFTDVADDAAYKNAVVWAYSVGVVTGTTETTFAPDSSIQRQAIAAMLARYIGADTSADAADLSAFSDAGAIQSYAMGAMSWAVENGLLQGNPDGTVDPRGNATRSAVATILQRFAPLAEGKAPSAAPAGDDDTSAPTEDTDKADDTTPADDTTTPAEGDKADSTTAPAEGDSADNTSADNTDAADNTDDTTPADGENAGGDASGDSGDAADGKTAE